MEEGNFAGRITQKGRLRVVSIALGQIQRGLVSTRTVHRHVL